MRLVSYNLEDLMVLPERKHTDIYLVLTDFLNSDEDCVRIEDYPHKNTNSCATSLRKSIKRFYDGSIKVIQRKGNVYLVKTICIEHQMVVAKKHAL